MRTLGWRGTISLDCPRSRLLTQHNQEIAQYSAFPSSCNFRLQQHQPIREQNLNPSALWLDGTVLALATGCCKNLEKRCSHQTLFLVRGRGLGSLAGQTLARRRVWSHSYKKKNKKKPNKTTTTTKKNTSWYPPLSSQAPLHPLSLSSLSLSLPHLVYTSTFTYNL